MRPADQDQERSTEKPSKLYLWACCENPLCDDGQDPDHGRAHGADDGDGQPGVNPQAAKARLRELQGQPEDLDRQADQFAGRIAEVDGLGMRLEEMRANLNGLADTTTEYAAPCMHTFTTR